MRPPPLSARYGVLHVASNMWACLFLQAKSGRCSHFWRESWLRYGFGRTRRKPRLCAYSEGSVWLETREGGAGRPMQGTFSGVHAHYRNAALTARAAVHLVVCLFCFIPVTSQARNGIIYPPWSIITIVDMSQSHSECLGDPDHEALHHFCFPGVEEREQQIPCTCYRKVQ